MHIRSFLLSLSVPVLATLMGPAPARGGIIPSGFYTENAASGAAFNVPVALAFMPDGRMLVAEKSGIVHVVKNGAKLGLPFIDISAEVLDHQDRGLLGMAVDPNFDSNGHVYFMYTVDWNGAGDFQRTDVSGRVARYRVCTSNPDVVDVSTRVVLIGNTYATGIPSCHYSHAPGSLRFGSDGTLLISTGDGASYSAVDAGGLYPNCFGAGKFSSIEDIGSYRSQWIGSLAGKILRIDPITGQGLPSNPFYTGNANDTASKVWSYGLRNPYRFGVRPNGSTDPSAADPGALYIGEVGWNTWEELNIAKAGGGENFGWPCYEGALPHAGYQSASPAHHGCATIGTPANPSLATPPAMYWNHNFASQSSPPGVTGSASVGGAFYVGTKYPLEYRDHYFYGDYTGQWIKDVEVDASDNVVAQTNFATGMGGIVSIEYDPVSQYLYYINIYTGVVYRIRHITGDANSPPLIVASVSPQWGYTPLAVAFTSSATTDPNGDNMTFKWDFGNGVTSTAPDTTYTYTTPGDYTIVLTVTDDFGATSQRNFSVSAGNTPPVATIVNPVNGTVADIGDMVVFYGTAADAESPEAALSFDWEITQEHNEHDHPNYFTSNNPAGAFQILEHGLPHEVNLLRLRLRVADPSGLADTAIVFLALSRASESDITGEGTPTALITAPTGTGNPNLSVMHDGAYPAAGSNDPLTQYDTYTGGGPRAVDWAGYTFPRTRYFSRLTFQEGIESPNGGWFNSVGVEVRHDGVWEAVDHVHVIPPYRGADGSSFDIYTVTFEANAGDGVRLTGTPGGSASYISVGELRVFEIPRAEFTADVTLGSNPLTVTFTDLSSVTSPTARTWNFGDGNSSTAASAVHTYTTPGPHTVNLSVTGAEGTFFLSKKDFVFVGTPGLTGEYYDDADFNGTLLTRFDPNVNFAWGAGAPDPSMGVNTFSVRWSGWVQPRYSESLTFHATTDDGVRLWVNNQLLIDKWVTQTSTEWTGNIALVADQLYQIRMEYFDGTGPASAKVEWSSPGQARQVIPQSRLWARECGVGVGDVDGSGGLSPGDAVCAFNIFINGQAVPPSCDIIDFDCEIEAADADCSGAVTPSDALAIYNRYLSGLPLQTCFASGSLMASTSGAPMSAVGIERVRFDAAIGRSVVTLSLAVDNPVVFDAFGLHVRYNPTAYEFISIERGADTGSWIVVDAFPRAAGDVVVGGFDFNGLTLAGPAELFRLKFVVKSGSGNFAFTDLVDDLAGATIHTETSDPVTVTPSVYRLHQNIPNPFNPETAIRFDIATGTGAVHTRLAIYTVSGELVRVLVDENREPGAYEERWNGLNARGVPSSSGVYFYVFEAGTHRESRRMVLLK